ncbi:MAG: replicative DNA helicase [Planctomycetes bacterium]|nr:replicative DNA helicase [Planctomycetota bacterium]
MATGNLNDQLPFDLEAEKCVLGSVLRDPRCAPEVVAKLRAEDFYSARHRNLFALIDQQEGRASGACDPVTIAHEMERLGRTEELGGRAYLIELMEAVPSVAFLENHVNIVQNNAIRRGLISAADQIIRLVHDAENDDVKQLVNLSEQKVFAVGDRLVDGNIVRAKDLIEKNLDKILSHDGTPQGLVTGFTDLDELQGFRPGDLIVLAARPAMGKTALSLNMMERMAIEHGKGVLMFSLEMPGDQLIVRMLSSHARIRHDNLRSGRLDAGMGQRLTMSAAQFSKSKLFIDDSSQPALAEIRAKARRLKRDRELDFIVVDYLQLLSTKAESRQQEITVISRTLKAIAREMKVPVMALSQLNRSAEKRDSHKPMLSDLRESGAIEQDADMVMMLFREEYYTPSEENAGVAELIIAKNRHGSTGSVLMRFTKECMRFENLVREPAF